MAIMKTIEKAIKACTLAYIRSKRNDSGVKTVTFFQKNYEGQIELSNQYLTLRVYKDFDLYAVNSFKLTAKQWIKINDYLAENYCI